MLLAGATMPTVSPARRAGGFTREEFAGGMEVRNLLRSGVVGSPTLRIHAAKAGQQRRNGLAPISEFIFLRSSICAHRSAFIDVNQQKSAARLSVRRILPGTLTAPGRAGTPHYFPSAQSAFLPE